MSVRGTSIGILSASAFAALLAFTGGSHVQAQQGASQPDLRVEGDYVRNDVEGSGSFDGLAAQFPKAELLPGVQPMGRGRGPAPAAGPGGAPGPAPAARGEYRA